MVPAPGSSGPDLVGWAAILTFAAVATGALHKYVYLPWFRRFQAKRAQEREDDLFLHGDEGVEDVRASVKPARQRLAEVQTDQAEMKVDIALLKDGQGVLLVAARALLTERGAVTNGTTRAAVQEIDEYEARLSEGT